MRRRLPQAATPLQEARRRGGVTVQTAQEPDDVAMEINVIGRTADEAHDEVARFVDQAFLAGLPGVRIVHGTGMGVLRRTIREYSAAASECGGGDGASVLCGWAGGY